MSGYAEEQLRNSIDIENVNFLPKPFSVTELAEAARRAAGPDSPLRFRARTLFDRAWRLRTHPRLSKMSLSSR